MAYRKIQTQGELGCLERIEYISPEGEWVPHPSRGQWAPCDTYPEVRTSAGGGFEKEKITFAQAEQGIFPCPDNCPDDNVTAILREPAAGRSKKTGSSVDMQNAVYERRSQDLVRFADPEDASGNDYEQWFKPQEGKEDSKTEKGKSLTPFILLIGGAVAAYVLLR